MGGTPEYPAKTTDWLSNGVCLILAKSNNGPSSTMRYDFVTRGLSKVNRKFKLFIELYMISFSSDFRGLERIVEMCSFWFT